MRTPAARAAAVAAVAAADLAKRKELPPVWSERVREADQHTDAHPRRATTSRRADVWSGPFAHGPATLTQHVHAGQGARAGAMSARRESNSGSDSHPECGDQVCNPGGTCVTPVNRRGFEGTAGAARGGRIQPFLPNIRRKVGGEVRDPQPPDAEPLVVVAPGSASRTARRLASTVRLRQWRGCLSGSVPRACLWPAA